MKRLPMAGLSRKAKRRKLAKQDDEEDPHGQRSMDASIRSAKKAARPKKIGQEDKSFGGKLNGKKKNVNKKSARKGFGFARDGESKRRTEKKIHTVASRKLSLRL